MPQGGFDAALLELVAQVLGVALDVLPIAGYIGDRQQLGVGSQDGGTVGPSVLASGGQGGLLIGGEERRRRDQAGEGQEAGLAPTLLSRHGSSLEEM